MKARNYSCNLLLDEEQKSKNIYIHILTLTDNLSGHSHGASAVGNMLCSPNSLNNQNNLFCLLLMEGQGYTIFSW